MSPTIRLTPVRSPERVIEAYLDTYSSEATRTAYRHDLYDFFGSLWVNNGEIPQNALEAGRLDVTEYLRRLDKEGKSPATLRRRKAAISNFFNFAIEEGYVWRNPVSKRHGYKIKGGESAEKTPLTTKQVRKLLAAAREGYSGLRNELIVTLGLYCGLRRSEIQAIDVEHFEQREDCWVLNIPEAKGGYNQFVKVRDEIMVMVKRLLETSNIKGGALLRSESRWKPGGRMSADGINTVIKQAGQRARIRANVTSHLLRHTAITMAVRSGADIDLVQAFARHKDPKTTLRYVHNDNALKNNAADYIKY